MDLLMEIIKSVAWIIGSFTVLILLVVLFMAEGPRSTRPKGNVGPKPRPNNKRVATKPEREE